MPGYFVADKVWYCARYSARELFFRLYLFTFLLLFVKKENQCKSFTLAVCCFERERKNLQRGDTTISFRWVRLFFFGNDERARRFWLEGRLLWKRILAAVFDGLLFFFARASASRRCQYNAWAFLALCFFFPPFIRLWYGHRAEMNGNQSFCEWKKLRIEIWYILLRAFPSNSFRTSISAPFHQIVNNNKNRDTKKYKFFIFVGW